MSVKLTTAVWEIRGLNPITKLVLLHLADGVNANQEAAGCWPSIETLAERVGVSDRSVQRHLRALEQAGWITVEKRLGRSSIYRLNIEVGVTVCHPPHPVGGDTDGAQGVTPVSGGGDTRVGGGVTPASPRTRREPEENQKSEPARAREGIDDAMEAIETEPTAPPPAPRATAGDLQQLRLVRLRSEQDRIDVADLLERHGWDAVAKAAGELRDARKATPWPSELLAALEPRQAPRAVPELLAEIRRRLRERWDIESYVGNALLDELILKGHGFAQQLKRCHEHHGLVSREWLEASLQDGSITLGKPRDAGQLAQMLERAAVSDEAA